MLSETLTLTQILALTQTDPAVWFRAPGGGHLACHPLSDVYPLSKPPQVALSLNLHTWVLGSSQ